jgi:hypothetical protein
MVRTPEPKTPIVSSFPPVKEIRCMCRDRVEAWQIPDRQERLPWWDQSRVHAAKLLMVGQGGLGSNQSKILVQMQMGQIDGIDPDLVELSNLNRQLFRWRDLGKPKAHQLLGNLRPYASYGCCLRGFFMRFEDWMELPYKPRYSAVCC